MLEIVTESLNLPANVLAILLGENLATLAFNSIDITIIAMAFAVHQHHCHPHQRGRHQPPKNVIVTIQQDFKPFVFPD